MPEKTQHPTGPTRDRCLVCRYQHARGQCPIQIQSMEVCSLCGISHFGLLKKCPSQCTEAQIRLFIDILDRESPGPVYLIKAAKSSLLHELAGRKRR